MKKRLNIIILTLIIVLSVGAAGVIYATNQKQKINYTVEEAVPYKGIQTKVTNVEISSGTDEFVPQEGKEYIVISVELKNTSDEIKEFNSFNYKLIQENEQQQYEIANNYLQEKRLNGGTVLVNATRSGVLVYEIPKGSKNNHLGYFENFANTEYAYKIKIN